MKKDGHIWAGAPQPTVTGPTRSGLTAVPHAGRSVGSAAEVPTPCPGFNLSWESYSASD